jgi:hypothetical protein
MKYGDLSNQVGPAIVINADLLVRLEKRMFGLFTDVKFFLSTRHLLEQWFTSDITIYIVCMNDYAKNIDRIRDMLDTFVTPYTTIQPIETAEELEGIVSMKHVVGYYFAEVENNKIDFRTNVRKHYQIPNIAEITYLLGGGEYR